MSKKERNEEWGGFPDLDFYPRPSYQEPIVVDISDPQAREKLEQALAKRRAEIDEIDRMMLEGI